MLYNYIKDHYKEAEPIFFSDLEREGITKSAINQQLKTAKISWRKIIMSL